MTQKLPEKTQIIDPDGFVSMDKRLNLTLIAIFIWFGTAMLYRIISTFSQPNYASFCLVVSLILCVIASIVVGNVLYKRHSKGFRVFACVMNVILLSSSVNGFQAGRAAIPANDAKTQELSIFSDLFDGRPWLRDADSKRRIEDLERRVSILSAENSQLQLRLQKTGDASNNQTGVINNYQQQNAQLTSQLDILKQRIQAHNGQHNIYANAVATSDVLRGLMSKLSNEFDRMAGEGFYNNFVSERISNQ